MDISFDKIYPYEKIQGHEQVLDKFGYWPLFQDAEVLWLGLDRLGVEGMKGPTLTAKIHAFETTDDFDDKGQYICQNHSIITFRFHSVVDLSLTEFNRQNAIYDLKIVDLSYLRLEQVRFKVIFVPVYGIDCVFNCREIKILSVKDGFPKKLISSEHV